ncbi:MULTISPECIES: hypothetical protein [Streptomyces]|uniref:Uncharacterized protein n=2 Tax=Streptomyces TaxID=1883 RepID=A0A2U9P0U4_STRAS|nr:hypothetical protein [Streptomyces actuosus]AWT43197.1 hypothetical protein DMT42_13280 [Streptomyces actuosus]MBM4824649.1 hypothetical protein [Streptomyces actuosus]
MKRTTLSPKTTSHPTIAAAFAAALAPTGHVHPLLTADAVDQTRERADQLAADTARGHDEPPAGACPIYRDCTDTTPGHYDHQAHNLKVLDERDTSTVLDAGMVAMSGDDPHAIVYVGVAEFTTAEAVKAKTAELRRFLDQVDAMADRVFADDQGRA